MMEKEFLPKQRIINCLSTNYGIKVIALAFIPLGADVDASVYKAQTYDQSLYFVKLKRGHHDIGTIIQLLLYESGIQHIIAPVKTEDNKPTHHIDDFTLIVYPFIEGQDGFSRNLTDNQWIALGTTLKHVHEFRLPPLIKDQIKRESYSSQWRNSVRSIYSHIDTELKATDNISAQLLAFMREHQKTIQHLVDRAEQLGQKLQQQHIEFVLCHSDIHGGNVLITNDENIYVIDWDQPIMAPKERDLMFIGGGVANVWNNYHEEELFYKGYGKTHVNKEVLSYYRHERIVEDIAVYCQQLLLTTDGGKNREIMYQHFIDMFKPRGVVDIAFKTDIKL